MNRRWLQKYIFTGIILASLLAAPACEQTVKPPDDLLPHATLAEVLADIYLSEVKAVVAYDLKLQKDEYLKEYVYPEVFRRNDVTDSAFYHSYWYYEQHPEKYEKLMDSVIAHLERIPLDSIQPSRVPRSVEEAYRDIDRMEQHRVRSQSRGAGAE